MQILRSRRELAQNSAADAIEIMLLYLHYDKAEAVGYVTGDEGEVTKYSIVGSDVVPENLYVFVDLEADLPTDRAQRTVTARAQIDAGINSRAGAMEDIGIKNVSETQDSIAEERLFENVLQIEMRNEQFQSDMQMRQQIQQEVMQQILQDPQFLQQIMQQE